VVQKARPAADISSSGWTPTPVYDELDEATPADGSYVEVGSSGAEFTVRLARLAAPVVGPDESAHALTVRIDGPSQVLVELLQGQELIAARTCAAPDGFADYTLTLTRQEAARIKYEPGPGGDPDLRVRVRLCSAPEGYEGPGWYCVRDAGTEDPCEPVELLDEDKCDDTLVICSGPYETEAEAQAECPVAPVETACCEEPIPETLTAVITSTEDSEYATTYALKYSAAVSADLGKSAWVGMGIGPPAAGDCVYSGRCVGLRLTCENDGQWDFRASLFGDQPCADPLDPALEAVWTGATWRWAGGVAESTTCNPFSIDSDFTVTGIFRCAGGTVGTHHITID
jgi:hypothetical protein